MNHLSGLRYSGNDVRGSFILSAVSSPNTFRIFDVLNVEYDTTNKRYTIKIKYTISGGLTTPGLNHQVYFTFIPRGDRGSLGGLTLTYNSHDSNATNVSGNGEYFLEALLPGRRRYTSFQNMVIDGQTVNFSSKGQTINFTDSSWTSGAVIATIYLGRDGKVFNTYADGASYSLYNVPLTSIRYDSAQKIYVMIGALEIDIPHVPGTNVGSIEFWDLYVRVGRVTVKSNSATAPVVGQRITIYNNNGTLYNSLGYNYSSALNANSNGGITFEGLRCCI